MVKNMAVSVYYTAEPNGFRVVATASDMKAAEGGVIRFITMLQDGQTAVVSVPGGVGEPAQELVFARIGDHLSLTTYPGRSGAPTTRVASKPLD